MGNLLARATIMAIFGLVSIAPSSASACSGGASFNAAVRLGGAVYYATIDNAEPTADGLLIDLDVTVQRQLRGTALRHIPAAQSGDFCSGIDVGQTGVVVLDMPNAVAGEPSFDLFYAIGKGHLSSAEAQRILQRHGLELPATSSAAPDLTSGPPSALPVLAGLVAFAWAARCRLRPDRGSIAKAGKP